MLAFYQIRKNFKNGKPEFPLNCIFDHLFMNKKLRKQF